MDKKSYREILTRYIQEHKAEEPIVTDQVVQYTAEELGKGAIVTLTAFLTSAAPFPSSSAVY